MTMRKHVVTIEDPIEFSHEDQMAIISQREIGSDTQDFATALRHVVRQNPDIIFIGEMRDQETIRTAISAAMTGHLVMATMHTIDVQQTIERIISYFPEGMRDQVAMDLSLVIGGIIAQRLVPRKDNDGRVPAFEVLKSTPLVSRLIRTRDLEPIPEILKSGVQDGMIDFNHSLHALVKEGLVELDVAASCATGKDAFMLLAQGMETGIDTLRQYSGDPDHGLSIKRLLREAIVRHSSDLILTVDAPPVIRVDGTLRPLDMPVLGSADTQKLLFSVLTPSQRLEFETNHEVDFALSVRGLDTPEGTTEVTQPQRNADFRFRVNGFYQKGSVACAMRVIPNVIPTPEAIGLPPAVVNLCTRQQGLVLVTGPTGSGKSTTLASMLNVLNQNRPCHIITIEDPIEFVHSHKAAIVEQREIHADTFSFANALKYVLRQDPDVILVGEMRDPETIATVLTAAETGHLVFATLHTNDVTQSVDRIIDVFPSERQNQIRSQLAACLEAIISQRLLPRKSGQGRVAIFEVLMGTLAVRALIRDKKTHQLLSVMETSMKEGMITMERALRNACEMGVISQATMLTAMPSNSKSSITGINYR
jgi:twitching motility protein PilT